MVQQGLLAKCCTLVRIFMTCRISGNYEGDWRLEYNKEFRGDVYATHGMGPAAQALDIHRDKMNILVAMDTKPVNIPEYLVEERGMDLKVPTASRLDNIPCR